MVEVSLIKSGLRIIHFIGLALGIGGATILDFFIFRYCIIGRVNEHRLHVIHFASKFVSFGLLLLWVSGIGFLVYYANFVPDSLDNDKIWAKIVIVIVLTVNGAAIHLFMLPMMKVDYGLFECVTPMQRGLMLCLASVSIISWYVPLALGVLVQLNKVVPMLTILFVYLSILALAIGLSNGLCSLVIKLVKEYHNGRR